MNSRDHSSPHSCSCDCSHHDAAEPSSRVSGFAPWATLAPILACAFCPVCLSHWLPIVAGVGIGVGLSERQHSVLLIVALGIAVVPAAIATRRTRRFLPLIATVFGALALVASDVAGARGAFDALGMAALVIGAVLARRGSGGAIPGATRAERARPFGRRGEKFAAGEASGG